MLVGGNSDGRRCVVEGASAYQRDAVLPHLAATAKPYLPPAPCAKIRPLSSFWYEAPTLWTTLSSDRASWGRPFRASAFSHKVFSGTRNTSRSRRSHGRASTSTVLQGAANPVSHRKWRNLWEVTGVRMAGMGRARMSRFAAATVGGLSLVAIVVVVAVGVVERAPQRPLACGRHPSPAHLQSGIPIPPVVSPPVASTVGVAPRVGVIGAWANCFRPEVITVAVGEVAQWQPVSYTHLTLPTKA